jgi:CDP-diacylglycerol---glycerol-3-phosphate 3-phosphatidyltransferase
MSLFPLTPPNQLTLFRILLTPVFVAFLFSDDPLYKQIALGIFIFAAITDWYDGYVARRWGYITRWGKFLDPLADKVLTSTAFISFVLIGYANVWMVVVIIFRDFLITFLRSYSEIKHRSFDTSSLAKTKTFLQLVVIYLFLIAYIIRSTEWLNQQYGSLLSIFASPIIMSVLMIIVTTITVWTGISYIHNNWKTLKELFIASYDGTEPGNNT